jgi:hypothetical protein
MSYTIKHIGTHKHAQGFVDHDSYGLWFGGELIAVSKDREFLQQVLNDAQERTLERKEVRLIKHPEGGVPCC